MNAPITETVLDLAVRIQQIPAPTFHENLRGAYTKTWFEKEGLADVDTDEIGNVYARLPGRGTKKPLIVSAHLDSVFPADTDLTVHRESDRIHGAGIGDNALGVAGLFGLLWSLRREGLELPGDLWLVANVGEEGLGNLRGMKAVVDRFQNDALAYIILEGMALGQIYYQGLEVQRYRITVHTPGGHSWVDYGRASAIHELARLVANLTAIPLPVQPRTTMNVGTFHGGTSINTIASEAQLELDLRSEDGKVLSSLADKAEKMVSNSWQEGVTIDMQNLGRRPSGKISQRHPLARAAAHALEMEGIIPHFNVGSTDANVPLSRGLPAVCIGLTTGFGAHTADEYIETPPLQKGLAQVVELVKRAFEKL